MNTTSPYKLAKRAKQNLIARGVLTAEGKLPEIADTEGKRVKRSKEETEALKYGLYCEELGITGVKPQDPKSVKFKLWTWANKFAGRRTAGGKRIDDRDALTYSPSLRAYETSTGDYSQLHRWAEVWSYWWNAIAIQFQNAERSRDFARLKALGNRKNINAFVEYLKLNTFRRVDVEGEDRPRHERIENPMPIEIERNFRDALAKTLAKGYPRMREFRALSFSIYFNGNNLGSKNASNTYCKIGEPYSPPNHRGPRCGKYRSRRVIRKIQFRFNGKQTWNELDVLDYRSDLLSHNIKGIRVCDRDGRWTLNPMINDRFEVAEPTKRVFAAIDLNVRKDDESISVIDIGGDAPFRQFSMTFTPNRKSRRRAADKHNTDLPVFETTKEGRKAYQRTMDDKKDAIKSLLGEPKESRLGWAGIKRRFAAGQIAETYVAFVGNSIEWHERAKKEFAHLCAVLQAQQETQSRKIAKDIVDYCREYDVTDLGIPLDDVKEMKEAERPEDMPSHKRHALNVAAENQQLIAPGKLRQTITWSLRKAGIRVHLFYPWRTSQRCTCGADTHSASLTFTCEGRIDDKWNPKPGCGQRIHRGVRAVENGALLARECSSGDTHPQTCSRDGKSLDYVGFPDHKEAVAKLKAARKRGARKRGAKQKKIKGKKLRLSQQTKVPRIEVTSWIFPRPAAAGGGT